QGVVELALPLLGQELDDRVPAAQEPVPVAPDRVLAVGERHPVRIAGVPGVLGGLDLLLRGLEGERWQRRTVGHRALQFGENERSRRTVENDRSPIKGDRRAVQASIRAAAASRAWAAGASVPKIPAVTIAPSASSTSCGASAAGSPAAATRSATLSAKACLCALACRATAYDTAPSSPNPLIHAQPRKPGSRNHEPSQSNTARMRSRGSATSSTAAASRSRHRASRRCR